MPGAAERSERRTEERRREGHDGDKGKQRKERRGDRPRDGKRAARNGDLPPPSSSSNSSENEENASSKLGSVSPTSRRSALSRGQSAGGTGASVAGSTSSVHNQNSRRKPRASSDEDRVKPVLVSPRGSSSTLGYSGGGGGGDTGGAGGGRRADRDKDRRIPRIDGGEHSGGDKAEDASRRNSTKLPKEASGTSFDKDKRSNTPRTETLDPVEEHQSRRGQNTPKNAASRDSDNVDDNRAADHNSARADSSDGGIPIRGRGHDRDTNRETWDGTDDCGSPMPTGAVAKDSASFDERRVGTKRTAVTVVQVAGRADEGTARGRSSRRSPQNLSVSAAREEPKEGDVSGAEERPDRSGNKGTKRRTDDNDFEVQKLRV